MKSRTAAGLKARPCRGCAGSLERSGAHRGLRRAYTALRDAGVLAGEPRSRFVVADGGAARAARWGAEAQALRLAGSDDLSMYWYERRATQSP